MQVINANSKAILVEKLEIAASFLTRLRGLLGKKKFSPGEGLLIKPCNWVHTFGMKFPIEVLFLDQKQRVVAIERLEPNQFGRPQRSVSALELPSGSIEAGRVKLGDQLIFVDF